MADFDQAIPIILEHEGGTVTLPDGAGLTCFGWTEKTCSALGISMPTTVDEASVLYQRHFWKPLYDQIISQTVATKFFDDAVNQGPHAATENLQKALNAVGSIVTVDGGFGQATLNATNMVPDTLLLPWMRKTQYDSYDEWINANRSARESLRHGLANRAAWPDPDGTIATALMAGTYGPNKR
jgi:lysozyme family protein